MNTKTIVVFGDGETWADVVDCHLQEVSVRQHRRLTQEGIAPKNLRCKQESLSARLRGEKTEREELDAVETSRKDWEAEQEKMLRDKISAAGDRHDWNECDRLDKELENLRKKK